MKNHGKTLVKFVCLLLMGILCISTAAACGDPDVKSGNRHLEIYTLNVGYGWEWSKALAEEFGKQDWVKAKYPDYTFNVKYNDSWGFAEERIKAGPKINTADILFSANLQQLYNYKRQGENVLTDLSDIYDETVVGESVKFKEKVYQDFIPSNSNPETGAKVSVPWGDSYCTILYNETLFNQLGYTVPVTTKEFIDILAKVKARNGAAPYTHTFAIQSCAETLYWDYAYNMWWAQYEGMEEYVNFFNGISENKVSADIFKQPGRLKTLIAIEDSLSRNNGYLDPSNTLYTFMEAQTNFLMGKGLFMINGDWFDYEMSKVAPGLQAKYPYTIRAMRMPVLSDIVDKTSITGTETQKDEALAAVIRAIDAGETEFSGVSPADFKLIKDARQIVNFGQGLLNAAVPSYSDAKDLAMDFVRFLATDKANLAYAKATNGGSLSFDYDLKTKEPDFYASMSAIQKDKHEVRKSTAVPPVFLAPTTHLPLVNKGGLKGRTWDGSFEGRFTRTDGQQMTAQQMYNFDIEYWTSIRWNELINNSGI